MNRLKKIFVNNDSSLVTVSAGNPISDPQAKWEYGTSEDLINQKFAVKEAEIDEKIEEQDDLISGYDQRINLLQNTMIEIDDKIYDPSTYSGLGRKLLKKHLVNSVNTLYQEDINEENTIYVIQYDYVLGENITVPSNCVLDFDGGSISASGNNDTITGNNTAIRAGLVKIFNTDVTLAGSWNVVEAYPEWFGAMGDGVTEDSSFIQKALSFTSICSGRTLKLQAKNYLINSLVDVPVGVTMSGVYSADDTTITGNGTVIVCKVNGTFSETDGLIRLEASTELKNLKFWYPNQTGFDDHENVIRYIPSILVKEDADYVNISNIFFAGSYYGIRAQRHKNLRIDNCIGFCFRVGIYIVFSHDVDRISNCHFNFNYLMQNAEYSTLHPQHHHLYRYSFKNGIAFRVERADWAVFENCFAYGYLNGFYAGSTNGTVNNYNLNIIGGGADSCSVGVILGYCHYAHISDITLNGGDFFLHEYNNEGTCMYTVGCTNILLNNITGQMSVSTYMNMVSSSYFLSNSSFESTNRTISGAWAIMNRDCEYSIVNCRFRRFSYTDDNNVKWGIGVMHDGITTPSATNFGNISNCIFKDCTETTFIIDGGGTYKNNINSSNNRFIGVSKAAIAHAFNASISYGSTSKRTSLTSDLANIPYHEYYDTDLAKQLYWIINTTYPNGAWVDATGNPV